VQHTLTHTHIKEVCIDKNHRQRENCELNDFVETFKMVNTFKIVVFPGDNCGPEVMDEAIKVRIVFLA
jgi:hypothetical protein